MIWLLAALTAGASDISDTQEELELKYPDPAVATVLSSSVGFGAGHFYSRRPVAGTTHLVFQSGGLTLAAIGGVKVIKSLTVNAEASNASISTPSSLDALDESIYNSPSYNPDTDMLESGLIYMSIGLSTYFIDHLADTLTAPLSAKRRKKRLIERHKGQ